MEVGIAGLQKVAPTSHHRQERQTQTWRSSNSQIGRFDTSQMHFGKTWQSGLENFLVGEVEGGGSLVVAVWV